MENRKIVILDGFTTVRDDLSWKTFEEFGKIVAYDRTRSWELIERAKDADAIITNKVYIGKEQIAQMPKLKYIGLLATGYNNIEIEPARERGIDVVNIPDYGSDSVAQAAFAHILNIAVRTEEHSQAVRRGDWSKCSDPCFCITKQTEIAGLTLGLIGYGAIAKKIAKIALGFGMKVFAYSPSSPAGETKGGVSFKTEDEIFAEADIVSLNCPLNEKTRHIVRAETIAKMKDGVWIINTGRGPLVDDDALADALRSGKVGAAGLDVLSKEPPPADNPLLSAPNCRITPHNAWTTFAARKRLLGIARDNLAAWLAGKKQNVVN